MQVWVTCKVLLIIHECCFHEPRGTVFISVLYNTILLWVAETQFKLIQQKWSVWIVQQGRLRVVTALDMT